MVEILYAYDKVSWRDDQPQKNHTIRDDVEEITTISQVVSIDFHEVEAHAVHNQGDNSIIRTYEITMAYVDGGDQDVFIEMEKIVKNNVAETESFGLYNVAKDTILSMTAIPIINKNSVVTYNCFFQVLGILLFLSMFTWKQKGFHQLKVREKQTSHSVQDHQRLPFCESLILTQQHLQAIS